MSESLWQRWLDKAAEDLIVAKLVLREGHLAHTCFLSQQTIEKTLKAYLIAQTNQYPRTHKLVDLLQQCIALHDDFSQFRVDCTRVDQFYIPTRYPDGIPGGLPMGMPDLKQANGAIEAADLIHQYVTNLLTIPDDDSLTESSE
jgi:HEPN domain-containing protein